MRKVKCSVTVGVDLDACEMSSPVSNLLSDALGTESATSILWPLTSKSTRRVASGRCLPNFNRYSYRRASHLTECL